MKNQYKRPPNIGMVIFLYQYSRLIDNATYKIQADKSLEKVMKNINEYTGNDFNNNIWGIGWGIEYLIQNGYVEGDADVILEDIDNIALSQINENTLPNVGLNAGIIGIGRYLLARITSEKTSEQSRNHLRLKEYLIYLIDWLESRLSESTGCIDEIIEFSTDLLQIRFYPYKVRKIIDYCLKTNEGINYVSNLKFH